jgi:hypothetical protein
MKGTINLHVGSLEDMGRSFVSAWKEAEAGQAMHPEHRTVVGLSVIASAAKQTSIDSLHTDQRTFGTGLLRCARNDDEESPS